MIGQIDRVEDLLTKDGRPYKKVILTNGKAVSVLDKFADKWDLFEPKEFIEFKNIEINGNWELVDILKSTAEKATQNNSKARYATEAQKSSSIEAQVSIKGIIDLWVAGQKLPVSYKVKALQWMATKLDIRKPDGSVPTAKDLQDFIE